jgi:two-component system, sensor histidine kinase and response regulator
MDVRMPGMGGLDAAALIRRRPQVTPLIFVTALADSPAEMRRGYEAGAVDYLVKPFDPVIVRSKVSVLVDLWIAKEQLRRSEQEAQERERFIGILAHDLRNPLAAIHMAAEFLATAPERSQVPMAARIKRSADRMRRMIDDVLDFARGRLAGGIPVATRLCDIGAVCQQVVDELRDAYPGRTIECSISQPLLLSCDADRVAQAVSNVLANALQHSRGSVWLETSRSESVVVVRITNDGDPVPAELLPVLFEPFRGEKQHGRTGLGLGLYIVKEIVRAHDGSVDVSSEDRRTVFTLSFPRPADPA